MEAHYTYLQHLVENPDAQKLVTALGLGACLVLIGRQLTSRLRTAEGVEAALIPNSRLSLFGFFDLLISGFVNLHDSILGKENRRHLAFTGSVFIFILFSNLLGLIPGVPAITTTVWINVGMALVVFCYFNYQGIKANGVLGYLKHFCGPVIYVAPLFFTAEIISTCLRILTLNLRLYWNINADHLILGVFTDLMKLSFPFYILGTFVSFMQAFVFTVLTMIYILLATQHEEHH